MAGVRAARRRRGDVHRGGPRRRSPAPSFDSARDALGIRDGGRLVALAALLVTRTRACVLPASPRARRRRAGCWSGWSPRRAPAATPSSPRPSPRPSTMPGRSCGGRLRAALGVLDLRDRATRRPEPERVRAPLAFVPGQDDPAVHRDHRRRVRRGPSGRRGCPARTGRPRRSSRPGFVPEHIVVAPRTGRPGGRGDHDRRRGGLLGSPSSPSRPSTAGGVSRAGLLVYAFGLARRRAAPCGARDGPRTVRAGSTSRRDARQAQRSRVHLPLGCRLRRLLLPRRWPSPGSPLHRRAASRRSGSARACRATPARSR